MAAVEQGGETLWLGRWGQITSFLQQVQLGLLLLLEATLLVQSASAEDPSPRCFPRKHELVMGVPGGNPVLCYLQPVHLLGLCTIRKEKEQAYESLHEVA